jgi:hypothetical protein
VEYPLSWGDHLFSVRARDAAGNVDSSPAAYAWSIDPTAPEARITSAPANPTNQATAIFEFTASMPPGGSYSCLLDGLPFPNCTSPETFPDLSAGEHNFSLNVLDAAGNLEDSAYYSWTIDLTEPETDFSSAPANPTNQTTASFEFTASEGSFECSLDKGSFNPCDAKEIFILLEGEHTLQVRARDAANNVDSSPAIYSWTIDLTEPETAISLAPARLTNQTTATFEFTSNEPWLHFECSLDEGSFSSCPLPTTFRSLSEGTHSFRVRAVDAVGNKDSSHAIFIWTIDTTPPDTNFALAPDPMSRDRHPSFAFQASEPDSTFQCVLDSVPLAHCADFPPLRDGPHSFEVQARDVAGNVDTSPAIHTWLLDSKAPATPILQEPAPGQKLFTSSPRFSGTADLDTTVTLFIDGGPAGKATVDDQGVWTVTLSSSLSWEEHSVSAMATDAAGNSSERLPEVTFYTSRDGYYGLGCSTSPATWQASWPWASLLLGLLRRRSRPLR